MNDPNRLMKWLLVVGLVALALLALYPPSRTLKGGIDLVGGTSMLLEIDTVGLDRSQQSGLATKVMNVLKDRVDPKGQLNLEWRPVGNTRLEIRMPRPPKEALERRDAKEQAVEALADKNLVRFDVEEALNASPEHQDSLLSALTRGVAERTELLKRVKEALVARKDAQAADDPAEEERAATAYEDAMSALLATNLPLGRLTDVLALDATEKRTAELAKLRAEYPSFDAGDAGSPDGKLISKAVAAYDAWAEDKADLEDPSDLKRRIKGAGVLEFRILAERDPSSPTNLSDPELQGDKAIARFKDQLAKRGPRPLPGDRFMWFPIEEPLKFLRAGSTDEIDQRTDDPRSPIVAEYAGRYYVLAYDSARQKMLRSTAERKWKLKAAFPDRDPLTGENVVSFTLDPPGGRLFGELTGANVKRSLCIMLDNTAVSYATIQERITERCRISGRFTLERVQDLVRTLDAGSLPARVKDTPLMEKTIGPSLGETNRRKGMYAAVLGAIVVGMFVLLYYGIMAGGMANVALALNLLFVLGAMALLQATFTLPGIAGLILTVGMAIDANVLIFERIREERKRGVVFRKALNTGYDKAFSTIMDANLTTLLTCVILGFVGSEEVKGFAITLGIGIVTSLFTSLFVTRLVFNSLIAKGWLHDFSMRSFVGVPNIDWLGMRRKFWPASIVAVIAGAGVFVVFSRVDTQAVYDIEFLGGTGLQLDFKAGDDVTDEDVAQLITGSDESSAAGWLASAADSLQAAEVRLGSTDRRFSLTAADQEITAEELGVLMAGVLEGRMERDGLHVLDKHTVEFESRVGEQSLTLESFRQAVADAVRKTRRAAKNLGSARVQTVGNLEEEEGAGRSFEVVTIETNRSLVQRAVLATIGGRLKVQRGIKFSTTEDETFLHEPFFVVKVEDRYLGDVLGGESGFDIRRFRGGVAIQVTLDADEAPMKVAEVERRLREAVLHADADHYRMRETAVFPLGTGSSQAGYRSFAVLAVDEAAHYDDLGEELWMESLARPQLAVVTTALASEKSLSNVMQFAPQVAGQARNRAVLAIVLALGAIVVYLSLRFGTKEYGLAAIVALVHDVSVTLGLVVLSRFAAGTILGDALLLDAFRVDLPMIAAILTVIGYSLNDTIVVFDRIRENRGRIGKLTAATINNSINQTLSRTLLTSITTFLAVVVLYIFGGAGVHGFSFALMMGVIVGTYSSIGIATPLLYRPAMLRKVIAVMVALGVVGMIFVATENGTTRLIGSGITVVLLGVFMFRGRGGEAYGRPATA